MAYMALLAADAGVNADTYRPWAMGQIHYALGDTGRSFVGGFGTNPPVRQHHRGAYVLPVVYGMFKASAYSFKCLTSLSFLKLSFSLCTYHLGWMPCFILFERYQSNHEEHGTSEHKKILFIIGFERSHSKETSLHDHRLNRSAISRLLWMKKLNLDLMPVNMYIYTIYK